ncbi:MAG: UDP-N-acetylmuramate dehydrogenase [Sumerlaeia bacterium]
MATRLENEPLSKHTTLKIGGPAEVLSIPDDLDDLLAEIRHCQENGITYRILGRGSNLLVNDKGVKGFVIKLSKACSELTFEGDGRVICGASVTFQKFIKFCIENDLYGNENLQSVPGAMGGGIFMNAGTWTDKNLYLSDYLVKVKYFDGKEIREIAKEDCRFGYRSSIFQEKPEWVILSAEFKLPHQPKEVGEKAKRDRVEWSKGYQDITYANAGSVFRAGHGRAYNWVKGMKIGGAGWSERTGNWINNYGSAKCSDVLWLIRIVKVLSFLMGRKASIEWIYWK